MIKVEERFVAFDPPSWPPCRHDHDSYNFIQEKFYCKYKSSNSSLVVKYFPQSYMLKKCLGGENLELFFRVTPKSICGLLL